MLSGLALLTLSPLLWAQCDVSQTAPSAQFAQRYDSGNGIDVARKVVVSGAGHVYVTGASRGTSDLDYYARKYDKDGSVLWSARYDSGNGDDEAWDIAVDGSGNAYVTGRSKRSGGSQFDYVTIKYANSDGSQVWLSRLNGSGDADDEAKAIGLDSSRNVYVTGWSIGAASNNDYWTVKLDESDGEMLWQKRYTNESVNGEDRANALAVRPIDNYVVVTGTSSSSSSSPVMDYATICYDTDGEEEWAERYNSHANNDRDEAFAVAVDAEKNAYVTGVFTASNGLTKRAGTLKYSPTGVLCWYDSYLGGSQQDPWSAAVGHDVEVFGGSYVIVGGYAVPTTVEGGKKDYLIVRYAQDPDDENCPDAENDPVWAEIYDHAQADDEGQAVAIDAAGNAYITGWGANSSNKKEYVTAKYGQNGNRCWVAVYNNGDASKDHSAASVAVDGKGNVVVTGTSIASDEDWATRKYCSLLGDVISDGIVDDADLAAILECFGEPGGCITVDLNGDGEVDDTDTAIVLTAFGNECP